MNPSHTACPRCGAALPPGVPGQPLFCPACGASAPAPAPAGPAPRYWLSRGGQSYGPYPLAELQAMASRGELGPEEGLCAEGQQAWGPAQAVAGLFSPGPGGGPPAGAPMTSGPAPGPGWPQGPGPQGMAPGPGWPQGAGPQGMAPGPGWPQGAAPQAPPPGSAGGLSLHLGRAFAWDLRSVKVTDAETAALRQRGIEDAQVQRFLAWRRSLLLYVIGPTALSALLGLIGLATQEWQSYTAFGVVVQLLWVASLAALPVAALLASQAWTDARRSRRLMTAAWAFSFLLPVGVALLPARWVFEMGDAPAEARLAASFLVGIAYFLTLLPLVLSLMPGLIRVSIRVKALLPESIVPGWFTLAAAGFYSLLLLVAFVLVLQIAGDLVLLFALAGLVAAPLVFVVRGKLFVRPILTEGERKGFALTQVIYAVAVGVALTLLLFFFLLGKIGETPIVGDEGAAVMTYGKFFWQVFRFAAEFTGRSLFITAVAVDYFLMMNLSVWNSARQLAGSEAAQGYDELMSHLGQVLGAEKPAA